MRQIITIALTALLSVAANAAPPTVDRLLASVPENSSAVIVVDLAALRAVPLAQEWLRDSHAPWTGIDNDATAFLRDAGLDPTRDVDLLVLAVTRGHDAGGNALVLAAGRYDPASLDAALVQRGATRVTVAGGPALRLPRHGGPERADIVVHTGDDLLVAGPESAVTAALGSHAPPSTLVAQALAAGQVDVKAPFWMVVELPPQAHEAMNHMELSSTEPEANALSNVVRATAAVQRVAVSGWLGDALTVRSVAVATTEENAGLLRDAIKGALAAARLEFQQRDARLVEPLRDTAVTVSGATVEVRASIPVELLRDLTSGHDKPASQR